MIFSSREEYLAELSRRSRPPEGFRSATASVRFTPLEKPMEAAMNLALILLEEESPLFAGVFTRNAFPGAPVLIGRRRLEGPALRGILVNNRISNVGAPGGVEAAEGLLADLAALTGGSGDRYLPASTGIIGWGLPVEAMRGALPGLVGGLQAESLLPAAQAIMTTDAFPKLRAAEVGGGRIVGLAKGAGMIEPNLATMLVFLLTDLRMEREFLRGCLRRCAERSFNAISIDSDQSTSDTAVLLSSGRRPPAAEAEFEAALLEVCRGLAEDIVRNGEGVGHVIRLRLATDLPEELARGAGKAVLNSPLVKTAVFGNDPNVGRLVSSLGDFLGNAGRPLDRQALAIRLGGIELFSGGAFRLGPEKEARLSAYLKECGQDAEAKGWPRQDRCVELEIELGRAAARYEFLGADLSYAYVRENADYRS